MDREQMVNSYEFRRRAVETREAFEKLMDNFYIKEFGVIGMPGYTPAQEKMLITLLACSLSSELAKGAQCTHRAVVAAMGFHFENGLRKSQVQSIFEKTSHLTDIVNVSQLETKKDGTFLILQSTNNWLGFPQELTATYEPLDCKLIHGLPTEVPTDHLIHLPEGILMTTIADVDNACPKRLHNTECRIIHAEGQVINTAGVLFDCLGLPDASKTVLTCTWVPCPKCFEKINWYDKGAQKFGKGGIDVFSLYGARGDTDDIAMADALRNQLKDLGRLAGPLISIDKNPGYGWRVAQPGIIGELRNALNQDGIKSIDPREKKLLVNAIEMLEY